MADPLEGFRDKSPQQIEDELREKLGDSEILVDFWQMGSEMQLFADSPAGTLLLKTFKDDLYDSLRALLELEDSQSPEARQLFMKARTRWLVLREVESAITEGKGAETLIIEADKQVTP